ncbi:hypothetical protein EMIHUDRAFT_226032 [Emiliania huxleyi CCMP1516]|uniref:Aldehyde oxidase/xanthine dehydrogenase a/b hammerhead domain-containing protein n=2 Tax=Emiliania huxleyi TaxID=2903 RepID=A0A0D3KMR4_EMIH1|nr:hypothetical protein EMIHUDRAFT_226032 [Emiliania huxleyi CCMP1516]EOD37049.1 hypothetical protein EMIHUDRAFT_226032 [Emiliania huxleyi CCMP1516]|eukprot:XP_005789478.1 hypothetical protein EMIHUDRAFT_226032 [Emiliania huxleyi CCMP1516]
MRGFVAELAAKAVESDAGSASDIGHLAPHEYRLSLVASPVSCGTQSIGVSDASLAPAPVSLPLPKLTSLLQASGGGRKECATQASGEALYSSDEPAVAGELCGAFAGEWWSRAAAEGKAAVEGKLRIGGQRHCQRHFYLETNTALALPVEGGGLSITCANQNPTRTQTAVAGALGLPLATVDVRVRRIGGAYGGKLNAHLPTAIAAAVAAAKHGRPVRLHNDRSDDMASTGGRPPMEGSFRLAVDQGGVVSSIELTAAFDSGVVDGGAVCWADNAYRADDFAVHGSFYNSGVVGSAARFPGGVTIPLHELAMEAAAEAVGLPADAVREANLYATGDAALCGVTVGENGFNWNLPAMWQSAKARWEVEAFNRSNRWRKRGLRMVPVKYGIEDNGGAYKEGCSLGVLADGSVRLAHGGCELGQGIHTKAAQAAAFALGCPLGGVSVSDTSSLATPGSADTGGSATSECVAVLDAAETLNARLLPFRPAAGAAGEGAWEATVKAATDAGDSLVGGAAGVEGKAPAGKGEGVSRRVPRGERLVEIDALSGETCILRADLLMDQGTPLNPEIDLGQVEGGFVMALGLFFSEAVVSHSPSGAPTTLGTWEYKASAEPPMALAAAAFLAARAAILAARADAGDASKQPPLHVDAPLTPAAVQAACLVDTSQFVLR